MHIFKGENFANVYEKLCDLVQSGVVVTDENDVTTRELSNVMFQIENPQEVLFSNDFRSSKLNYIAREIAWYINGDENVKDISKYAPLWGRIADDNGMVHSNYGNTIFRKQNSFGYNSWYWAVSQMSKDRHTRKAYIPVSRMENLDPHTKDFVCCEGIHFSIRNNCLDMTVKFRSNDILLGLPNDIAFMGFLQTQMYNIMNRHYAGLRIGKLTYNTTSLHAYLKDIPTIKSMLDEVFYTDKHLRMPNIIEAYGTVAKMYSEVSVNDAHKSFKDMIISF